MYLARWWGKGFHSKELRFSIQHALLQNASIKLLEYGRNNISSVDRLSTPDKIVCAIGCGRFTVERPRNMPNQAPSVKMSGGPFPTTCDKHATLKPTKGGSWQRAMWPSQQQVQRSTGKHRKHQTTHKHQHTYIVHTHYFQESKKRKVYLPVVHPWGSRRYSGCCASTPAVNNPDRLFLYVLMEVTYCRRCQVLIDTSRWSVGDGVSLFHHRLQGGPWRRHRARNEAVGGGEFSSRIVKGERRES